MDRTRAPRVPLRRAAVASVIAAAGVATLCGSLDRADATSVRVERRSVWTERVERGVLRIDVASQGTLVPERVHWLSAGSAARVARIAVRPGEPVAPDTLVLVLENSELELAALEAERQTAGAESALRDLETATASERGLAKASLATLAAEEREARERAAAASELAAAGVLGELDRASAVGRSRGLAERLAAERGRQQALDEARRRQRAALLEERDRLREIAAFRRRQLAALQVRAGVRGVVQEIAPETGQWVTAGATLAKIGETGALIARMKVAEGNAKELRPGLAVRFDGALASARGRVRRIEPIVTRGHVELDVALDGTLPGGMRPDQAVTGAIELARLDDALFVARPAAAREGASTEVFRLEADGVHARRISARFGRASAHSIEVLAGLRAGDAIIVSDTSDWLGSERVRLE